MFKAYFAIAIQLCVGLTPFSVFAIDGTRGGVLRVCDAGVGALAG